MSYGVEFRRAEHPDAGYWESERYRQLRITRNVIEALVYLFILYLAHGWWLGFGRHVTRYQHPLDGLTYVDDSTEPQLNDFRKQAISHVIDPTLRQLERLRALQKSTDHGRRKPADFEAQRTEFLNRLKEIMTEGRLRRIPTQFKKRYDKAILSLQQAYRSINTLSDCFDAETEESRKKIYNESVKQAEKSRVLAEEARKCFTSSEWRSPARESSVP